MRRREFITLIGGVAVGWPLAALAQRPERIRRIGVLMNFRANDPEGQARVTAFVQGLQKLGWTEGRNVRFDIRWAEDVTDGYRRYSEELVELNPDVILASASPSVAAPGHPKRANCVCECRRPGRCRVHHQLGTAGRQQHRIYRVRIQP
jgi:putative ABC transport system substrate-binding protein